jgi:hypothetical protein
VSILNSMAPLYKITMCGLLFRHPASHHPASPPAFHPPHLALTIPVVAMEGVYLHTYPQASFPQCPPVLEERTNSQPSEIFPFPQNLQFRGDSREVSPLISCGTSPYKLTQNMQAYQVFPFIRPSDSMYQMTFPCFTSVRTLLICRRFVLTY